MGTAALFAALRFSSVIFSLHPPFQSAQLSAHHLFRVHALQNAPRVFPRLSCRFVLRLNLASCCT